MLVVLALVHVIFPRYFDWKIQLGGLSLINRQMMYVHTFFIALVVLLMGVLCVTSASELVNTPLGQKVCTGLFVFWFARLIIQFFGYSSELWKGKPFELQLKSFTWAQKQVSQGTSWGLSMWWRFDEI